MKWKLFKVYKKWYLCYGNNTPFRFSSWRDAMDYLEVVFNLIDGGKKW